MKNVNDSLLSAALRKARAFIEEEYVTKIKSQTEPAIGRRNHWNGDYAQTATSFQKRNEVVAELHKAVNWKTVEVWSLQAVEKQLDITIYAAFGFPVIPNMSFLQRLETSLMQLSDTLSTSLSTWEIMFPVLGMQTKARNFNIGNVRFRDWSENALKDLSVRLNKIINNTAHTSKEIIGIKRLQKIQLNKIFAGSTIAIVKVNAGELVAARSLARNDLMEIVDIFNFFTISLFPTDLRVRVHLKAESRSGVDELIALHENNLFTTEFSNEFPLALFDVSEFKSKNAKKLGMTRMKQILEKDRKTELESNIVSATRTGGKAHVAFRKEDAFLQLAIAIESLVMGGDEKTDITYKLSTRCAQLLGKTLSERMRIKKEITKLYKLRSSIAHKGFSIVSDDELAVMRSYASEIIRRFLVDKAFFKLTKKEQVADHFDECMLK